LQAQLALARAGGRGSEARAARARAAAATAAVRLARGELARTRLVAPVDGVVLERRVDPGDTITGVATGGPPQPLFEIADPTRLELRLEVEDEDAARLALGQAIVVTPEGGGAVLARATIDRLAPRLGARTIGVGSARVRADGRVRAAWARLDGGGFVIGQPLEAAVVLARRAVATRAPRAAVAIVDGAPAVATVLGGLWVRERAVSIGVADESWVELRGVDEGEALLLRR
jgi:multidrug efflux pump subunit AcrA (membrane-fusion protein)